MRWHGDKAENAIYVMLCYVKLSSGTLCSGVILADYSLASASTEQASKQASEQANESYEDRTHPVAVIRSTVAIPAREVKQ